MPGNVTGFQPSGNLKKSLIDLAYFNMWPRRSPTFFREEPKNNWAQTSDMLSLTNNTPDVLA